MNFNNDTKDDIWRRMVQATLVMVVINLFFVMFLGGTLAVSLGHLATLFVLWTVLQDDY